MKCPLSMKKKSLKAEIWHYEKANVDHIRRSIDQFSWVRCFANTSVNNKVHIFNKTVKNMMSNYYYSRNNYLR